MDPKTARIRALNDELRHNLSLGHAVMTTGVAALGAEAVARIVKTIEVYDNFCHANDPYEEHDFGSFEADGHTIFFKIDYFDSALTLHSPDPSDPCRHQARHHHHAGGGILIFVEADFEILPEERRQFAIINVPRQEFSQTTGETARRAANKRQ